jgi:hypothetical protein
MTTRDKAQAGLWLLKQAILEVVASNPQGMQPSQVRDALGWIPPESPQGGITYAVMTSMSDAGELERGEGGSRIPCQETNTVLARYQFSHGFDADVTVACECIPCPRKAVSLSGNYRASNRHCKFATHWPLL